MYAETKSMVADLCQGTFSCCRGENTITRNGVKNATFVVFFGFAPFSHENTKSAMAQIRQHIKN